MMSTSTWRMNGLYRRIGGVLLLWILLLNTEVMCQDDTDTESPPAASSADPGSTVAPDASSSAADGQSAASTAAPGDVTSIAADIQTDSQDDGASSSQSTVAPVVEQTEANTTPVSTEEPQTVRIIVPVVQCIEKEEMPESSAVKAEVSTQNCEETKRVITENPAAWCSLETCNIELFQDEKMLFVKSKDANLYTLADALQSEHLKDKLGVTKTETPSSSGSSVFVGILVTGLLAALGIIVGYFKCKRNPDAKGVKLAEEGFPVDQENQGNTLVSDAPLNPPPETQEKPSVNGESPEGAKTQTPPPTNGHSTAKTADTEL